MHTFLVSAAGFVLGAFIHLVGYVRGEARALKTVFYALDSARESQQEKEFMS